MIHKWSVWRRPKTKDFFDFDRSFIFHRKISANSPDTTFIKFTTYLDFKPKILTKKIFFWSKFPFLTKISGIDENFEL